MILAHLPACRGARCPFPSFAFGLTLLSTKSKHHVYLSWVPHQGALFTPLFPNTDQRDQLPEVSPTDSSCLTF